jgi:uncharacterized protein YjeT (DUF2065 family)
MNDLLLFSIMSVALFCIIEGLLYALFTDKMRHALLLALSLSPHTLRLFGFIIAAIGFIMLFVIQIWVRA